ncbi:MAG: glycosyltransferase family 2 protein, partial [Chloroflexota bacterium]
MPPLLSIVIPAYNRPEMLDQCLRSVQTISPEIDYEVVVVDDASPVSLEPVLEEHTRQNPRLRWLRNPTSLGIPRNFNRCLAEAQGDYVCMMGDDDLFLPGNFEKKLALLRARPGLAFVFSRWYMLNEPGAELVNRAWPGHASTAYVGGRDDFRDLFIMTNYINLISAVFPRALYQELGGFDERIRTLCDWDMFLRFCRGRPT